MDLWTRGGRRAILGTIGLVVAAAVAGCGGSHNSYPDASVFFDARPDTGNTVDAGVRPPPPVGDGVKLLAPGPALLVGIGSDSCTNQDPPSGDRWCAFALPSTFLGGTDLWAINVTHAMAAPGGQIHCDVSDLDCLLLTSTLYAGDLTVHGFFGDTLVYYADTGQSVGSAFAWRPGMTAARRLSSNVPLGLCTGQAKGDAVRCLQNPDGTTVAGQTSLDLTAGNVSVGGNAALPKVVTLIATLTTDPPSTATVQQPVKYRAGFSPDGTWIAWSARPTPTGVETLMAQKLGDDSTRVVVAADVSRWLFSRDGAKLYWLKSFNYSATAPLGTLQMTDFPPPPAGTPPTVDTLAPNVSFFTSAGDKGLLFLGAQNAAGAAVSLLPDRAQVGQTKIIDSAVTQLTSLSRDGRAVVYSRSGLDLFAGGLDLATPCTLTAGADNSPFGTLSDPPTTAFWVKPDATLGQLVGNYTNLATCQTHQFASDLGVWDNVKDQGIVFGDGVVFDTAGNADMTLRYASFTNGALPTSGTVIQERVNPNYSLLLPYVSAVVFTVNAGGGTDGIYVKPDLPFPVTTPSPPDGGGG
jgi:hypothetical protein